jgi:hypothetical protein
LVELCINKFPWYLEEYDKKKKVNKLQYLLVSMITELLKNRHRAPTMIMLYAERCGVCSPQPPFMLATLLSANFNFSRSNRLKIKRSQIKINAFNASLRKLEMRNKQHI